MSMSCRTQTKSERGAPDAVVRSSRGALVLSGRMLAAGLLLLAGCWLFDDNVAPVCVIVQPTDSSAVSGVVLVRAEATDSSGIKQVEFYVDGTRLAASESYPYEANWDTQELPGSSWHKLFCIAEDLFGNKGYSDTVNVQVVEVGEKSIFHGRFKLPTGYYWPVPFAAVAGESLVGDFRISGSGVLSRFIWLTAEHYRAFAEGRSYLPLIQETNRPELTVRALVAASDSFYLVFLNTSGAQIDCWVRFSLE